MHPLYEKLYALLDKYEIEVLEDVLKLSNQSAGEWTGVYSLDEEVYFAFTDEFNSFRDQYSQVPGIKLLINTPFSWKSRGTMDTWVPDDRGITEFKSPPSHADYQTLVKKSILYGTAAVFSMGEFTRWAMGRMILYAYAIPLQLYEFLLHYRPLIENDLLFPIPSTMTQDGIEGWFREIEGVLRVSLTDDELRRQLTEQVGAETLQPAGYVNLYLPHLRNVPLETMAKIRVDEGDAFLSFQRQLEKMLQETMCASMIARGRNGAIGLIYQLSNHDISEDDDLFNDMQRSFRLFSQLVLRLPTVVSATFRTLFQQAGRLCRRKPNIFVYERLSGLSYSHQGKDVARIQMFLRSMKRVVILRQPYASRTKHLYLLSVLCDFCH